VFDAQLDIDNDLKTKTKRCLLHVIFVPGTTVIVQEKVSREMMHNSPPCNIRHARSSFAQAEGR